MPLNQKQFERLSVLHNLFSQKQCLSWEEMATACFRQLKLSQPPSRRTVYNDLAKLRMLGARFEKECGARGMEEKDRFRYEPGHFFSLHAVINPTDAELASEIKHLLSQFEQLPQFKGFEGLLLKIQQRVGIETNEGQTPVVIEKNDGYKGQNWVYDLYRAILGRQTLKITYQNFEGKQFVFSISPYTLGEANNRWFLIGWNAEQQKLNNLPLDRIRKVEPSIFAFVPCRLDLTAWYFPVIGYTRPEDGREEDVQIRVRKKRAYYVDTKPLHPTQRIVAQDDASITFSYRLIPNRELTASLLELGADAEVLAPAALREELIRLVRGMQAVYGLP